VVVSSAVLVGSAFVGPACPVARCACSILDQESARFLIVLSRCLGLVVAGWLAHFLWHLYVRGLGVISLLPRVRRLPDLMTHRTGTPSWSDGGVWFSCVFPTCVMVCSKRVQVRMRLYVSVRRMHVVMCVWEIKRINITRVEIQMLVVLREGLLFTLCVSPCPGTRG
jgi:hypothetical protein